MDIKIDSNLIEIYTQKGDTYKFLERFIKDEKLPYTIEELSSLAGVNPNFLLKLIEGVNDQHQTATLNVADFDQFSIQDILVYLNSTHEYYNDVYFKELERSLFDAMKLPGIDYNFCSILSSAFSDMKRSLKQHMRQEEEVLFPYASCLATMKQGNSNVLGFLQHEVELCFTHSHDELDFNVFRMIKWLMPYYFDFNNTSGLIKLEALFFRFKKDLEIHAWVEDELLLPKVVELRNELKEKISRN